MCGHCEPHSAQSQHRVYYLLAWFDVGVDVLEHRFEHGIVAHTQVLDLYLTILGPVLRYLRGVSTKRNTGEVSPD